MDLKLTFLLLSALVVVFVNSVPNPHRKKIMVHYHRWRNVGNSKEIEEKLKDVANEGERPQHDEGEGGGEGEEEREEEEEKEKEKPKSPRKPKSKHIRVVYHHYHFHHLPSKEEANDEGEKEEVNNEEENRGEIERHDESRFGIHRLPMRFGHQGSFPFSPPVHRPIIPPIVHFGYHRRY